MEKDIKEIKTSAFIIAAYCIGKMIYHVTYFLCGVLDHLNIL